MEEIPKGIYTQAFREEAVRLALGEGRTVRSVARQLSMPMGTLNVGYVPRDKANCRRLNKAAPY